MMEKLPEHRHLRWQENDLIFPATIGNPMDPHNLLKSFKEVLGKAGLPDIRFHDLRHTSVTLILNDIGGANQRSAAPGRPRQPKYDDQYLWG